MSTRITTALLLLTASPASDLQAAFGPWPLPTDPGRTGVRLERSDSAAVG